MDKPCDDLAGLFYACRLPDLATFHGSENRHRAFSEALSSDGAIFSENEVERRSERHKNAAYLLSFVFRN